MHHPFGRVLALILVLCLAACANDDVEEIESATDALSGTYVPPACNASCVSNGTLAAMNAAAKKYGFPRWFVYATAHRETSFDPNKKSVHGATEDDVGYGLTQLTGEHHTGLNFPSNIASPNQADASWQGDMRIKAFCAETGLCPWIDMANVSKLASSADRVNPAKNLDRYFSGYAAPAFYLEAKRAPQQSGETRAAFHNRILRRVAWHWRYGHYTTSFKYPTDPGGYFSGSDSYRWDNYASTYRTAVEADDGVWDGNVCTPPYVAGGCGASSVPASSPSCSTNDSARFNFECGDVQGWKTGNTALVPSVVATAARAYNGSSSLAIGIGGAAGTRSVSTSGGTLPTAGKTVSFRVWVPAGSKLSWVQVYVQENADGGWRWTSTTKSVSDLSAGAWNTVTVTVPANAAPVASMGLQLGVSSAWTGTVHLDSVTW